MIFNLLPEFETNTYLVWEDLSREAILIDPSSPNEAPVIFVKENNLTVKYILNTHGHADHIGGNAFFHARFDAPVCIHNDDSAMLHNSKLNLSAFLEYDLNLPYADVLLTDGDILQIGDRKVQIIHTPGHTKGGISILIDDMLFSGDTLFLLDVGRTDLPGGNFESLKSSILDKLFPLSGDVIVLPGHGPASTINNEKQNNPYL